MKYDGAVVTEVAGIMELITDYYRTMFTSQGAGRIEEVLQHVPRRVTAEMNHSLMADFSDVEIKRVLDDIGDLKAPGADSMSSLFYKQYWHIVGRDVIKEVKNFLRGGVLPEGWNETVVVLIPKVQQPEKIKD